MTTDSTAHSMDNTHKHTFFIKNGYNLPWQPAREIKVNGRPRMVENYLFKGHEKNQENLIFFCKSHMEKLKDLSYTFSEPTNPNNLGFYRISHYYDPETKVHITKAELQSLLHNLLLTTHQLSTMISKMQ